MLKSALIRVGRWFFFHGIHLAGEGRIQAAMLRPALVKRSAAHAMRLAQLDHRHSFCRRTARI
ncbi:MAG: hypothetical protein CFE32_05800 [Alphaproteobacteria bacterium PA3]|nr:MAG: hypothetical protein CFE32_05800 [Alphaproteobacteria bacterium PA3]